MKTDREGGEWTMDWRQYTVDKDRGSEAEQSGKIVDWRPQEMDGGQ